MAILFHYQEPSYRIKHSASVKYWLNHVITCEGYELGRLDVFIVDDPSIKEINNEFLEHDYFTDVISFNYSERRVLGGEIYISYDTVKSNAVTFNNSYYKELLRVVLHGVLHMIGFEDSEEADRREMRKMEDKYLEQFKV